MDKRVDALGEPVIFSALDTKSEYWHVKIGNEDKNKSAFSPNQGLYWFTRMLFGLESAPCKFQKGTDVIIAPVNCHKALVFLEDIEKFF